MKYKPKLQFEDKYNIADKSVAEIRRLIKKIEIDRDLIDALFTDSRKTTTKIALNCERRYHKIQKLKGKLSNFKNIENQIYNKGYHNIYGFYVTGLTAAAGPLTLCILKLNRFTEIKGIDYCNNLTHKQRINFFEKIKNESEYINIEHINAEKIDKLGLKEAIKTGYREIEETLEQEVELDIEKDFFIHYKYGINKRDNKVIKNTKKKIYTIACASIAAKVHRENRMKKLHSKYPGYHFDTNYGYITKEHRIAVKELGFTPIHRKTFDFEKKLEIEF